jgi:hypothetical protein
LSLIFGVAWWNARKELRLRREIARELGLQPNERLYERARQPNLVTSTSETQRLEESIEAIALEVERLAEGQRFVARLLSERGVERVRERPSAPPAPVITPH